VQRLSQGQHVASYTLEAAELVDRLFVLTIMECWRAEKACDHLSVQVSVSSVYNKSARSRTLMLFQHMRPQTICQALVRDVHA
jgi:hypothetical protein